jgi:hypothetical protein
LLSTTTDDAHAKRWRQWQIKNEHDDQKGTRRARLMFAVIFLTAAIWLGLQMLR